MKNLYVLALMCVLAVPGFASEGEVSDATAPQAIAPTPTPIARSAIVVSYHGHEISAGLFRALNLDDLQQLSREKQEGRQEGLQALVERTLLRALVAHEAKKSGGEKVPEVARSLREGKIDWLFQYYQRVYTRENFKPTDEDVRAYYEAHLDEFREREQFKFRHIFFKTIDQPPEKQEEALKRAQEALARLKAGEDFVKVANEYSDSEKKGAVVGPFYVDEEDSQKKINPLIQQAVLALNPGQTSDIFPTKYGYEILRLEEYVKPNPKPLEQVRYSIEQTLLDKFVEKSKSEFRQRYIDEALTDWNPGIIEDASAEEDAVICRVYGEPVTVSMYKGLFRGLARRTRESELQAKGRDEFIKELLVLKMIAYKKALDLGLDKRLPTLERMQSAEIQELFGYGINERWRAYVENNPITEEQTKQCYEENRDRLLAPRQAEVAEIFRRTPPFNKEVMYEQYKAQEAAKGALRKALERINAGEDFAAVAKEVSEATTAADGGYVGMVSASDQWRGYGFISEVFRLAEGGISTEPVEVQEGYALVHAIKFPPREPLPLEEARSRVERILLSRMQREFYQGLVNNLIHWDEVKIDQEVLAGMAVRSAIAPEQFYEEQ